MGSLIFKATDGRFHKYVEPVETIFKNLPKPLKWQSFLVHDLLLLTDIPSKVQYTKIHDDLDHLLGSWSEQEYDEIQGKIDEDRKIDRELWK